MTADISLSNGQYEIDVNSNDNLIIKDSTDTIILKHEDGGAFSLGADLQLGDLVDGSTGDTVYDGSTETIGNGTQTVDANSVSTDQADISSLFQFGTEGQETISSGSIDSPAPRVEVFPESGTSDDLDNMTPGSDGEIVIIRGTSGNSITVRHRQGGTGQFALDGGSNTTLSGFRDSLMVYYIAAIDEWIQVGRGDVE